MNLQFKYKEEHFILDVHNYNMVHQKANDWVETSIPERISIPTKFSETKELEKFSDLCQWIGDTD